jgi:hypothetical protein
MGVSWRHQIWYGIKTTYEQVENLQSETNKPIGKLQVSYDVMNGEYGIIGIPIFISEDGRYEEAYIPMMEIPELPLKMRHQIVDYARKWGITGKVKILAFTHYT